MITSLQDGQSGGGVSEALLEQNKMEKRMIEQQLSNAEQQLQQLRTELSVSTSVKLVSTECLDKRSYDCNHVPTYRAPLNYSNHTV